MASTGSFRRIVQKAQQVYYTTRAQKKIIPMNSHKINNAGRKLTWSWQIFAAEVLAPRIHQENAKDIAHGFSAREDDCATYLHQ